MARLNVERGYYTLTQKDLELINQRRRLHNRLGFAVQLAVLRFPGRPLKDLAGVPSRVLVRDASARGLVPAPTSAHTLRHTFARNYLAEHPGDIVELASLLGHTSLDTARIYSQPTIEQLSTRVEQL